jgi:hypothetical protein
VLSNVAPDLDVHATLLDVLRSMFAPEGKVDNTSDGARFMDAVRTLAGAARPVISAESAC